MTALVYDTGVLWTHKEQPILQGFLLVQSLAQGNRVIVATAGKRERMDHQLRTERLQDLIADVVDNSVALNGLPLWQRQLESVRSQYPLDYVVTADPVIAQHAVAHGVACLFFAHPGFSRPAMRPDISNRAWNELVEEVESRA